MRLGSWGREGGGGIDPSACGLMGTDRGTRSPHLVPQGQRVASLGWACWTLHRREAVKGGSLVGNISERSLHLSDKVVSV